MKFILLAISLFFASNTYAAILNNLYIYDDDSKEDRALKEELKVAKDKLAKQYLRLFKTNGKNVYHGYDKDEIVYEVGDTSRKDVGAKIGMSTDQVLNKTYWGLEKPDYVHKVDDKYGGLEQWYYNNDGALYFDNGRLSSIQIFR